MISNASLDKTALNRKVLIDSNIIIYLTDTIQPYASLARRLFEMVETGETEAVISILSIGEVMRGPLRKGQNQVARQVRDYLTNFPNSYCQDITYDVLEKIGQEAHIDWKGLPLVDSLIIASGLLNNVDIFISNDRHFIKSLPREMLLSFDS